MCGFEYVCEFSVESITEIRTLYAVEIFLKLCFAQEKVNSEYECEYVVGSGAEQCTHKSYSRADKAEYTILQEVWDFFGKWSPVELLEVEFVEDFYSLFL